MACGVPDGRRRALSRAAAPVSLDSSGGTDDAALIDRGLLILVQKELDCGQYD